MKPRRKTPEQDFQKAVAQYLTLALPTPEAWFTTIPAGGGGKVRGAILKGMGYKPGTPDMLVIYDGQASWLELKTGRAKCSRPQELCCDALHNAGCNWALVRTLEEVESALRTFGVPLRASVGGVVGEAA